LVVVAVTNCPSKTLWTGAKLKEALPCLSALTCVCPRLILPSPEWEGSSEGLMKNWMMKILFLSLVLGVLLSVPFMMVFGPNVIAEVRRR